MWYMKMECCECGSKISNADYEDGMIYILYHFRKEEQKVMCKKCYSKNMRRDKWHQLNQK